MKVDLYFSFRSPYSYLILPRMVELRDKHGVDVNFKQVYPLAIREPEFFKGKNLFTYFLIRRIDYVRQAKNISMSILRSLDIAYSVVIDDLAKLFCVSII